jgi:hypothetical protein
MREALRRILGIDAHELWLHNLTRKTAELEVAIHGYESRLKALEDAYLEKPKPKESEPMNLIGGFVPHSVRKKRLERQLAQAPEKKDTR